MRRWIQFLAMVLIGFAAVAGTEGDGKREAPSGSYGVGVRYGAVEAVSGALNLRIPLGPRLPGRIPLWFT